MIKRTLLMMLALASLGAVLAASALAAAPGAVVFSRVTELTSVTYGPEGEEVRETKSEGGLFAARRGRLNQLTTDPGDSEPSFSPDGRTIVFARSGDLFSVRPDGSGQRHLTDGPAIDSAPLVSPDGKLVVFERRAADEAQADLYRVRALGGGLRALATTADGEHDASFSPDGRAIVFVRSSARAAGDTADDLYSMSPAGLNLSRLTRTVSVDEFEPRHFAGGVVFNRGESTEGPSAYADIFTMRRNGSRQRPLVAGVGSAYLEDVSPDGRTTLFRRDLGLWVKRIGKGRARKLSEVPDNSTTNGVFSSDGRRIAAFIQADGRQSLSAIDVRTRRSSDLASGYDLTSSGASLGPVIDWQPTPRRARR